ncbi:tetratricopeptide repeat protein [Natronincola ferrireducens]|uniref:Tetratricopeptide repeat-containing protein n=1 Tax=Natronincola ferrireducens TaxID=393762 RepID=A0A1G9EN12_9FIRM|nr:tetratricopeptide repeat protein [Natronincola ferrireducens]SDK77572.1 Tetratricopeptide repeat-containing protein [Natronincola ferrireducens]
MKFLIDEYLLKKTEELSFIHLKHDAQLNIENYQLPSDGLDIPIMTKELAKNIKTKKENEIITVGSIVRGMILLLGIDSRFKYKEEYIKFLYAANPKIEKYIFVEGTRYLEEKKLMEAIIFFKALTLLKPNDTKALLSYTMTLLRYRDEELGNQKKNYETFTKEIQHKLEELLTIDPNQPLACYYLGFIYKDNKAFNKAKLHWEKALTLELEDNIKEQIKELLIQLEDMAQYEKGYEAILEGRPHEGLSILEKLAPKYTEWWNLAFFLGLGYRQTGKFHEAIQYFKKVLELKEDQLEAVVELALCYGGMGELQKSIEYFHKGLELGGDNSDLLCNLAMVYLELGDIHKAKDYVNKSLKMNPHDEITIACKNKVEEIEMASGAIKKA